MRQLDRRLEAPIFALLIVLMFACGGGSSSSGGGSQSTETRGVFIGTFRVTIESGNQRVNDGGTMTMLVGETSVTRDPSTDATSGSLDGNRFTIVNPATSFLNEPGVNCRGLIQQVGQVAPGEVNGNIFSNDISCNGVPFRISGTFSTKFHRKTF